MCFHFAEFLLLTFTWRRHIIHAQSLIFSNPTVRLLVCDSFSPKKKLLTFCTFLILSFNNFLFSFFLQQKTFFISFWKYHCSLYGNFVLKNINTIYTNLSETILFRVFFSMWQMYYDHYQRSTTWNMILR